MILALDVPRAIVTPPLRQWHHHDLFGGRGIHPPDELLDMDLAVSIGVDRPKEMQDGVITQPPRKGWVRANRMVWNQGRVSGSGSGSKPWVHLSGVTRPLRIALVNSCKETPPSLFLYR